jgi:hypothetical protein
VQWREPPPPPGLASSTAKHLRRRYGAQRAQRLANQIVASMRAHRSTQLASGAIAERTRDAWLVVQFGGLSQRLEFLKTLHIARLDLSH